MQGCGVRQGFPELLPQYLELYIKKNEPRPLDDLLYWVKDYDRTIPFMFHRLDIMLQNAKMTPALHRKFCQIVNMYLPSVSSRTMGILMEKHFQNPKFDAVWVELLDGA